MSSVTGGAPGTRRSRLSDNTFFDAWKARPCTIPRPEEPAGTFPTSGPFQTYGTKFLGRRLQGPATSMRPPSRRKDARQFGHVSSAASPCANRQRHAGQADQRTPEVGADVGASGAGERIGGAVSPPRSKPGAAPRTALRVPHAGQRNSPGPETSSSARHRPHRTIMPTSYRRLPPRQRGQGAASATRHQLHTMTPEPATVPCPSCSNATLRRDRVRVPAGGKRVDAVTCSECRYWWFERDGEAITSRTIAARTDGS